MKLSCPRKEFVDAVSMAASAASVRTSINILQYLKIEAKDQQVRILGCDGEMWVERKLACLVEEPGDLCLHAKTFSELVASLPDGDVQLTSADGGALLTQGASEYRLQTLDPSDYPEPPEFGGEGELALPMGELRSAVDSVLFAVSTDQHRQVLTGVMLQYDGSQLTLVATDTHRLAVKKVKREGIGSTITAIVPEKAVKAIKSLPLGDTDEVAIRFGGGRLGVEANGARIVSQLLSGAYPSWERVVPTECTRVWRIEKDQLEQKVKRAIILARDNAFRVRFRGAEDQIQLSARSDERGEAKEELTMVPQNGDVEIAFNGKYVLDALGPIHDTGVRIEMTESSRPAVVKSAEESDDYFCVIMPMALA